MRDTVPKDGSRGWYKPEGYAAFLAEAPMSTPVYADATRYHARTWAHSDEPDPNRSWYKPQDKSESSGRVGDRVISDVVSKTKVSGRTLSMARRFYNALKSYLT